MKSGESRAVDHGARATFTCHVPRKRGIQSSQTAMVTGWHAFADHPENEWSHGEEPPSAPLIFSLDSFSYRTIFPDVRLTEGRRPEAFGWRSRMRRPRACLARTLPGGLGSPSGPTTGARLERLDAGRVKGGESCPDRGGENLPGPGSTVPGTQRRRRARRREAAARSRADLATTQRLSAPRSPSIGEADHGEPTLRRIVARSRQPMDEKNP